MIQTADHLQEQIPAFPPLGKNVKALLVWPKFPGSYWSFAGMMELLPEKVVMPPLGLITVAALCPKDWTMRLVDEALEDVTDEDILWADLVMVGGMEVQWGGMRNVLVRARNLGRRTIVGGPCASSSSSARAGRGGSRRGGRARRGVWRKSPPHWKMARRKRFYEVINKPDVTQSPIPRFDLLKLKSYASMSIQFSRGCPFQCEFCDIIILYGRKPRTKHPQQVLAELDALLSLGWMKQVFMVDDNFIGNHARALELCVELEKWQQKHGLSRDVLHRSFHGPGQEIGLDGCHGEGQLLLRFPGH